MIEIKYKVDEMRRNGMVISASFLSSWKSGLALSVVLFSIFIKPFDKSALSAVGYLVFVAGGVVTWVMNAYYVRAKWKLQDMDKPTAP